MNKQIAMTAIVTVALVAAPTSASELVREFSGSESTVTQEFVVESPWILDWRLDGDYDRLLALEITLVEARTGRHVGRVLRTKYKGNGVKMFHETGRFQLRISSTLARWRVKIEQLSHDEAEQYTPRNRN